MQRILLAAAAASLALLITPAGAAQPTIPIIVKDTTALYWQTVLAGARKAGKDLNVNVPELGAQAETDVNDQISTLQDALAANPAAVVIAPAQFEALGKPIDIAAKKVKIIGIDSPADTKAFVSMLATDDVAGGRIAADGLAAAIQDKYGKAEGDVALIAAPPSVAWLDQRAEGFRKELAAKYPGLKIVADKPADSETGAAKIMSDAIAADANLRGVFAASLIAAQGVGQTIADAKKSDSIKTIGFDSDAKTIKFLQDGVFTGLVLQDPFRMGYDGIKTALAASKGEQVPPTIDTGANLITKANMDSPRAQELLNPKVR